jgi:CTP synthase
LEALSGVQGILVPGGFGERGTEGKIKAVKFAREHKIPYFGICLGMQLAVIEIARNLAGLEGAGSSEFGACEHPIVGMMTEWMKGDAIEKRSVKTDLGGTMRLGAYDATLEEGSHIAQIYGATSISERHRHRYEVNTNYMDQLKKAGLRFSGVSPDGALPETVEIDGHPWFIGVQFHPELKSKPFDPHPLFVSFIEAALKQKRLV